MHKLPSLNTSGSLVKKMITPALFVLLFASLAGNGYFVNKVRAMNADPEAAAKEDAARLVEEVGSLMVLPSDEEPTVATVTDPEQLKDQPFFEHAQKGYKVLLYATAKKAILFDPVSKKIIEVAPINIGSPAGTAAEIPAAVVPSEVPAEATGSDVTDLITP